MLCLISRLRSRSPCTGFIRHSRKICRQRLKVTPTGFDAVPHMLCAVSAWNAIVNPCNTTQAARFIGSLFDASQSLETGCNFHERSRTHLTLVGTRVAMSQWVITCNARRTQSKPGRLGVVLLHSQFAVTERVVASLPVSHCHLEWRGGIVEIPRSGVGGNRSKKEGELCSA